MHPCTPCTPCSLQHAPYRCTYMLWPCSAHAAPTQPPRSLSPTHPCTPYASHAALMHHNALPDCITASKAWHSMQPCNHATMHPMHPQCTLNTPSAPYAPPAHAMHTQHTPCTPCTPCTTCSPHAVQYMASQPSMYWPCCSPMHNVLCT